MKKFFIETFLVFFFQLFLKSPEEGNSSVPQPLNLFETFFVLKKQIFDLSSVNYN